MKDNSIEVFINEEFGYRYWKWIPNMTEQEFIAWYKDLTDSDIIKFYFNIRALPGKVVSWNGKSPSADGNCNQRVYGDPKTFRPYYYMHMHDVNDTIVSVGDEVFRRRPTMKYDWKVHWLDYQLDQQREFGESPQYPRGAPQY
jgi:hypothetical protein